MELYFSPLACSLATRIALYEAGADARYVQVDGAAKRTASDDDFWAINPMGQVPTLRTDDGTLLTENSAVLQHVAEHHPQAALLPAQGAARDTVRQWLSFIGTELHKGLFMPLFDKAATAEVRAWALAKAPLRLAVLERQLSTQDYLAGTFSIADAYLATVLNWAKVTGVDLAPYPAVRAYHQRVLKRPAVARAVAEEFALYRQEQAAAT